MSTRIGRIAIGAMMATTALVALGIPTAQADTLFDFGIVYYVASAANFTTAFGTGTTGAHYGGTGGSGNGFYEETNTTTKNIAFLGSGTAPASIHLPTEYAQNSNPLAQLVFTNIGTPAGGPAQPFGGFPLSGNPGPPPSGFFQYVQTLNGNSTTSPNSFQYQVGGVGTQFALISIGLANIQNAVGGSGVDIKGFLNGVQVADTGTFTIPSQFVGGNGHTGVNASVDIVSLTGFPGFGDVNSVEIIPTGLNVNVNDITISPVAVPAPIVGAGLPGLIVACGALIALARRRRQLVV